MKTIINPHLICRPTERKAPPAFRAILESEDTVAADNFVQAFTMATPRRGADIAARSG